MNQAKTNDILESDRLKPLHMDWVDGRVPPKPHASCCRCDLRSTTTKRSLTWSVKTFYVSNIQAQLQ
jgi:hypothetical protein